MESVFSYVFFPLFPSLPSPHRPVEARWPPTLSAVWQHLEITSVVIWRYMDKDWLDDWGHEKSRTDRQTTVFIFIWKQQSIFFHFYCDSSLQLGSYMIFVLIPRNTITKVTLLYARLPFFCPFFLYCCHFYTMTCALIFLKERKIFFKDIIVVMISVHNRGRIEIEKSRKKRIYWSNTHRYRVQRYTLNIAACPTPPKTVKKRKRVVSLKSPQPPPAPFFSWF